MRKRNLCVYCNIQKQSKEPVPPFKKSYLLRAQKFCYEARAHSNILWRGWNKREKEGLGTAK